MVWPVNALAVKSLGEVAVLSAVAMSKLTPPGPAGDDRLTVKVKAVVPPLPSLALTSLIVRVGGGTTVCGVIEKLSTARPSSAPGAMSKSFQRIQKEAPFGMLRPVMEKLGDAWFPGALPFRAPRVVLILGLLKSRLL